MSKTIKELEADVEKADAKYKTIWSDVVRTLGTSCGDVVSGPARVKADAAFSVLNDARWALKDALEKTE
jgi:hypothetical protein